jgi:hypothetical protein
MNSLERPDERAGGNEDSIMAATKAVSKAERLRRKRAIQGAGRPKNPEVRRCTVDCCERVHLARGLCKLHYMRARASDELSEHPLGVEIHGGKRSRLYNIWVLMKGRCNNSHNNCFHRYGGRGITFCEEWGGFTAFRDWAIGNGYADNLTIDRINNDGNYEPANCRWIPFKEQAQNKSQNVKVMREDGKIYETISAAAEENGIRYQTLYKYVQGTRKPRKGYNWFRMEKNHAV